MVVKRWDSRNQEDDEEDHGGDDDHGLGSFSSSSTESSPDLRPFSRRKPSESSDYDNSEDYLSDEDSEDLHEFCYYGKPTKEGDLF